MSATTISAAQVKELRELTGAGIMECKRALEETGGDVKKAEAIIVAAGTRQGRQEVRPRRQQGVIEPYIHRRPHRRARRDQLRDRLRRPHRRFQDPGPRYRHAGGRHGPALCLRGRDPRGRLGHARATSSPTARPPVAAVVLLEQPFIKDPKVTIRDLVQRADRQARREHRRPPLRPLRGRRRSAGRTGSRVTIADHSGRGRMAALRRKGAMARE